MLELHLSQLEQQKSVFTRNRLDVSLNHTVCRLEFKVTLCICVQMKKMASQMKA